MSQVVFVMLNWWQGSWNDWGLERRLLSTLFCNYFANIKEYMQKFWHNMGTYSGHLWYKFQWAAAFLVEVSMLFVCFDEGLERSQ